MIKIGDKVHTSADKVDACGLRDVTPWTMWETSSHLVVEKSAFRKEAEAMRAHRKEQMVALGL